MTGARTAGGLICSHGSDLDTRIPRAKMPKSALPQSLRIKLGFEKKNPRSKQMNSRYSDFVNPYAPGANVLKPRESSDGRYKAGCQKNFLRRGSGSSFSSFSAQKKNKKKFRGPQRRSYDSKTASTTPQSKNYNKKKQQQQQHKQQRRRQQKTINTNKLSKQCKISLNQIEDRLHDDYSLPIDERPML